MAPPADRRRRLAELWNLGREILREAMEDEITGESARVAYFFFLSLFPLILALFALTGIFGGDEAFSWIMGQIRAAMPGQAAEYFGRFVQEITGTRRPGILSLGILLVFWSASNIFAALTGGLNKMYDVEEDRRWWKRRALAIVFLIGTSTLLVVSTGIVLAGPELVRRLGLDAVWNFLRWPTAYLLVVAMMWLIYYLLPNYDRYRSQARILVGAVVGTGLWVCGTALFRLYLANFGRYSETYGVVGGIIVLLIWLYLTALTILFGGEVAATLEQRAHSVAGKRTGEDHRQARPQEPSVARR